MKELSVNDKINSLYKKFTKTEKKIAKFVIENSENVLKMNISECAEKSGVSEASWVRFSKNIGFKGFHDFRISLAKNISPGSLEISPKLKRGDSNKLIFEKIFNANTHVLNSTFAQLNYGDIDVIVEKFSRAQNIYLFGTGGSYKVVSDAQHKFLKVGLNTISYEDIDLQLMSSVLTTKNDVVIAVSFSGANYNTIRCIENAKKNKAFILSILTAENSPMQKLSDYTIISSADETIFQSESISTRIAQLTILDSLITCISMHDLNYEYSHKSLMETRDATSDNKY